MYIPQDLVFSEDHNQHNTNGASESRRSILVVIKRASTRLLRLVFSFYASSDCLILLAFLGAASHDASGSKEGYMITLIVKMLLFRLFWSALWGMGWGMLLDGGMPDIAHMSMGWGVALFLFLLAFVCLLADLPTVLVQRQHMPKEHAEKATHAAGAGARTPFFILQKGVARRGCNTPFLRAILQGLTARFTAFWEEWVATHSETQEKNHAGA